MGELTREEVIAGIEASEARIDARAQVTDSKIDALGSEMGTEMRALAQATDSKIDALRNEMKAEIRALAEVTDSKIEALGNEMKTEMRALAQATDSKIETLAYRMDGKMDRGFVDVMKWMVGTAIAMMAIAVTVIVFLFNYATPRHLSQGGAMPPVAAPAPVR